MLHGGPTAVFRVWSLADAARLAVAIAGIEGLEFGGGLEEAETVTVVGTDGARRDGAEAKAYIGGFSVIDVPTREEALRWAARIADACRCAQEVREFVPGSTP